MTISLAHRRYVWLPDDEIVIAPPKDGRRTDGGDQPRLKGGGASAHTDWMNECVPNLMGMGKDQLVAVAACLNMWRDAWEESHPDGADDPGPSPKEADSDSPLADTKHLARERLRAWNEADHPRDEHGRWTDGGGSSDPAPSPPAPSDDQIDGATKSRVQIQSSAEKMAKKLDFDPAKIVYTDEDKDFELAGHKYKYAGSYQRGEPGIKLYMRQITAENVKGITAHEIGHRKFEMLRNQLKAQTDMMNLDPGPPPDPNHQYFWGRRGGTDAMMTPTGEMRPPYDEKYPLVHEWAKIQNMRPSLEQDDGITEYSKTYWAEWEKGKMPTDTAYHETMAEMSRNLGVMGKHSAVTGAGWRRLYDLQESVWAKTDERMREMSMNEKKPLKALFVIDGLRWELR